MDDILTRQELINLLTRAQNLLDKTGRRLGSHDRSGIAPICAVVLSMFSNERVVAKLVREASRRNSGMYVVSNNESPLARNEAKLRRSLRAAIQRDSIPNSQDALQQLITELSK